MPFMSTGLILLNIENPIIKTATTIRIIFVLFINFINNYYTQIPLFYFGSKLTIWRRRWNSVAGYIKCFLTNARPDPDFKYFSNSNALCLSLKTTWVTSLTGRRLSVAGT